MLIYSFKVLELTFITAVTNYAEACPPVSM